MQHNNAQLSFCSFVTHFRDTHTQTQCSINSIDLKIKYDSKKHMYLPNVSNLEGDCTLIFSNIPCEFVPAPVCLHDIFLRISTKFAQFYYKTF